MPDLIEPGDTDRPRERSPEAGSNRRMSGSAAFQICCFPNRRHDHPDEKYRGADTIDQQARGPGRAEMLAKTSGRRPPEQARVARAAADDGATESSHPFSRGVYAPRVHPPIGSKPAKGATPGAPPDGKREDPKPPGQAVEPGERKRVRNTACEKRPRRMTRPRTGRLEPAPADVERVTASASTTRSTPATAITDVTHVDIFATAKPPHSWGGNLPDEAKRPARPPQQPTPTRAASSAKPHGRTSPTVGTATSARAGGENAEAGSSGWSASTGHDAPQPACAVGEQTSREAPDRACRWCDENAHRRRGNGSWAGAARFVRSARRRRLLRNGPGGRGRARRDAG